MATFTRNELKLFEDLFNLHNGHVLNMSRKKLEEFIYNSINIDITSETYEEKVRKHRKFFSMKQIYRFIVECEDKDKSVKFLNDLINYIDDNNLKNIDEDLLIKAKNILKSKSDDFTYPGENGVEAVDNTLENTNENEIVKIPFPAYDGDEPYIFISYAHKDKKIVFNDIKRFHDECYNIWYDEGITAGEDWDDVVADALTASSLVVAFISKNSMNSDNVIDEIKLALTEYIDIVLIYLEETQLSSGLKLRLGSKHAILKYLRTYEDYLRECFKAFDNANFPEDNISLKEHEGGSFDVVMLPGCNKKQSLIFKDLCDFCLDKGFDAEIDPVAILDMVNKYYDEENYDKLADKIRYSLKNLEKHNYISSDGSSLGMGFSTSSITFHGFCFYLKNIVEDKSIYSNMIRAIFVDELSTIETISKKYDILPSFVEMLIRIFRKEGYVVCNNNLTDITVTPAGEEYFEEVISQ